jgi:hypothetical protein
VLARHGTREALDTLISTAKSDSRSSLRGEALFWLAQRAGLEAWPPS